MTCSAHLCASWETQATLLSPTHDSPQATPSNFRDPSRERSLEFSFWSRPYLIPEVLVQRIAGTAVLVLPAGRYTQRIGGIQQYYCARLQRRRQLIQIVSLQHSRDEHIIKAARDGTFQGHAVG